MIKALLYAVLIVNCFSFLPLLSTIYKQGSDNKNASGGIDRQSSYQMISQRSVDAENNVFYLGTINIASLMLAVIGISLHAKKSSNKSLL